jgi:hypothetical protein
MTIMQKINCRKLQRVIGVSAWNLSNEILYEMCRKHPRHESNEEIIAKVLMIGRVYSAAIERRKNVENTSSMFYLKQVAPGIRKSKIDKWLDTLRGFEHPTSENCIQIMAVHKKVTNLFSKISGLEKRSLSSKYLHFHFPDLFFIYDSRSSTAIRQVEQTSIWNSDLVEYDYAYAKFFLRCMAFVEKVNSECRIYLTPRQLDKYLLY